MADIQTIAVNWVNGEDEARTRLRALVVNEHRFDARDRAALAWLLTRPGEAATARRAYLHEKYRADETAKALSEAISRNGDESVYEDLHRKFSSLLDGSWVYREQAINHPTDGDT